MPGMEEMTEKELKALVEDAAVNLGRIRQSQKHYRTLLRKIRNETAMILRNMDELDEMEQRCFVGIATIARYLKPIKEEKPEPK